MRGRNITQVVKAVDLLCQPEGITINQMAKALEVDRRNVYRVLDVIQDLGFPIYDEVIFGRQKTWKMEPDYALKLPNITLPDVRLNVAEVIALHLLRAESTLYAGTDIEARIDSAFAKLSQFVPNGLYGQLKKLNTLFVSNKKLTKDYSGKEDIIDALSGAMLRTKTCIVIYHAFVDDLDKTFRIDPLHFFESNGGLYLFVRVPKYGDIRILAVERINSIEELDKVFNYPVDFSPEEKLSQAFGMVYDDPIDLEVVFSACQAKYIKERIFSPDQEIQEHQDGSVTLKMKTSGWHDVKRWILGFGSEAVVVRPVEMRDEIVEEYKVALERNVCV
ncbi:Predicted DNA-binding transcriptional regulator YafY, contains an HTH and WYL domains [Desulfonatronum thiosulfatophilum]|uniref:Predicted DNA-binding transcriptional regulator YafY, contains an HTH and WYL domains n=1 Tax=Desulfonatronum thiosulfatophilum TaxID=617002 RepID=A0A1G6DDX6_9BACT|nr:WYL domain-containing transcriptional regulator [Desulfonatronum thiosulfatophilum]SDB43346.1 Predicted DNA-binding transcriptional regulator YafY, contains an HTH and WYL domains [Desulfonatronum thiosulfatophilum]